MATVVMLAIVADPEVARPLYLWLIDRAPRVVREL